MVKRYGKPSYQYGNFVERQLEGYDPSKRKDTVYYEFEKDKQKIKDDYDWAKRWFTDDLHEWERKNKEKKEQYITNTFHYYSYLYWLGFIPIIIFLFVVDGGYYVPLCIPLFFLFGFIYMILLYGDKSILDTGWERSLFYRLAKNRSEKGYVNLTPRPEPPEKPDNYPRGRPRVKKTRPYRLTKEDKYYDEYLGRQKQYQTETNCPICNASIQFTEARKPPFDDRCEICEYSFTFIYKEVKERYQMDYDEKVGRVNLYGDNYYDGIKPTRPRAPSKGDYVSDGKRQPIPQDVKDKVWNRDEGKCTQCGSNENLEFDHIIPVSKGGANTYRNIQLLCEVCNREKSDNIG